MDDFRDKLISQIDSLVAQILAEDLPLHSQLQVEANLVVPQSVGSTSRRIVLSAIEIGQLRQLAKDPVTGSLSASGYVPISDSARHMFLPPPTSMKIGQQPPITSMNALADPPLSKHVLPVHASISQRPAMTPRFDAISSMSDMQGPTPPATPAVNNQPSQPENVVQKSPPTQSKDAVSRPETLAVDKLLEGMWRSIHDTKTMVFGCAISTLTRDLLDPLLHLASQNSTLDKTTFSAASAQCIQVTNSNRTIRPLEVLLQTRWVDLFDARLSALREEFPALKQQERKKMVMLEACNSFSWAEKELRNRMAIWKGYREIKDAAGWVGLIFAGPGLYRYCKYRSGFDLVALQKLRAVRVRAEVAADTLQPQWRELLALVHEPTHVKWTGHPHDWSVSKIEGEDPLPLPVTYHQWDINFSYRQIQESIVDEEKWGSHDPRRSDEGPDFYCKSCGLVQSTDVETNGCECFSDLYSQKPWKPCPVQIFRTANGKNNGLTACCTFEPGQVVGEFAGMITKGLANLDVMHSQAGENEPYQIWQGRCGNFTRFINHSCASNCSFQTFSWLGVQRILVVSNGVQADEEITVDYSDHYWDNLDKICLCGTSACRFKDRKRTAKTT